MSHLREKAIAICIPSRGLLPALFVPHLMQLAVPANLSTAMRWMIGKPAAEARNELATAVLRDDDNPDGPEVVASLWLDDDVLISPKLLLRLLSHNQPIVAGACFLKRDYSELIYYPAPLSGTIPFQPGKVVPFWGGTMGLCLIRTEVFRKLRDGLPLDKNGHLEFFRQERFDTKDLDKRPDHTKLSEDLYFFELARKAGYQPLLDMHKDAFAFHYCGKRLTGYPTEQYQQSLRGEPMRWQTAEGEVVW